MRLLEVIARNRKKGIDTGIDPFLTFAFGFLVLLWGAWLLIPWPSKPEVQLGVPSVVHELEDLALIPILCGAATMYAAWARSLRVLSVAVFFTALFWLYVAVFWTLSVIYSPSLIIYWCIFLLYAYGYLGLRVKAGELKAEELRDN